MRAKLPAPEAPGHRRHGVVCALFSAPPSAAPRQVVLAGRTSKVLAGTPGINPVYCLEARQESQQGMAVPFGD